MFPRAVLRRELQRVSLSEQKANHLRLRLAGLKPGLYKTLQNFGEFGLAVVGGLWLAMLIHWRALGA